MARGITESVVHDAADFLVAAGDRPTVERIRAHLGTGSPNTVVRWLDTWWKGLPDRLNTHRRHIKIPEAPAVIQQMAGEWWKTALDHSRQLAEADTQALRVQLEAAQTSLAIDRKQLEASVDAAKQHEALALAQVTEMRLLISQLESRFEHAEQELLKSRRQLADTEMALKETQADRERIQIDARQELTALNQHVRSVEDRSHLEIDRARQESRALNGELRELRKQALIERRKLESTATGAKAELTTALGEVVAYKAKAAALEGQLLALHELPSAVNSALQKLHNIKATGSDRATKSRPGASKKRQGGKTPGQLQSR